MARQSIQQIQRYQNTTLPFEKKTPGNTFAQDHLRGFFLWDSLPHVRNKRMKKKK